MIEQDTDLLLWLLKLSSIHTQIHVCIPTAQKRHEVELNNYHIDPAKYGDVISIFKYARIYCQAALLGGPIITPICLD